MVPRLLILCLAVLIPTTTLAGDTPVLARPGDYVRVEREGIDSVQGELVRVEGGTIDLRLDDGAPTTLATHDLGEAHVSGTGEAVPDYSTHLAWILGTATFAGGWAIYFTAEDADGDGNGWSAFAQGLQQTIGTFVVFAGTPVMAGFGWIIGATAENGEWRRARFDDDTTRRHDALRRRLALDRARNAPPRPFGPSISTSF